MARKSADEKIEKLKKKIKKLKERISSIRFEIDDLNIMKEELPKTIKAEVRSQLSSKIKKMIRKEVEEKMEEARLILQTKLSSGYFDFVKEQTREEAKKALSQVTAVKIKSINLDEANQEEVTDLIEKGWRIIFFGDLKLNKHSTEPNNIILLAKHRLIKNNKKKKTKEKKKVKRSPK